MWSVRSRSEDPWTWRKILKARDSFAPCVKIMIGDGRTTSLFYDNWLQLGPIHSIVEEDVKTWGRRTTVRQWWNGQRWEIPSSFRRRHPRIVEEIEKMQISEGADKTKWLLHKSGHYTIGSMYEHLREHKEDVTWHRLVWSGIGPQKCRMILWLLVMMRLKTKDMLNKRDKTLTLSVSYVLLKWKQWLTYFLNAHILRRCGRKFWQSWD